MSKFQDLTGQRFGRLVVIKRLENNSRNQARWLVKCDCGNTKILTTNAFKKTKSCGCLRKEVTSNRTSAKLEGKKYGKLTVMKRLRSNKKQNIVWLCKCECGNFTEATTDLLNRGEKLSCGCLNHETLVKRNTTHGLTHTRLHHIWCGMKTRCYNSNRREYKWYGALGVEVCKEWKESFESFYNWSLSHGYKDNLTIDRINPYGNYEPSNCRWATWTEQNLNKRTSHKET